MKRVELAVAARAELDAAADHYEAAYRGRGVRFYRAVERTTLAIARFPAAAPLYPGLAEALGVRRRVVRGFPFVIVYRDQRDVIRVDAVAHTRRQPGYWLTCLTR